MSPLRKGIVRWVKREVLFLSILSLHFTFIKIELSLLLLMWNNSNFSTTPNLPFCLNLCNTTWMFILRIIAAEIGHARKV